MLTIEQRELVEQHVSYALRLADFATMKDPKREDEFQSEACNALVECALRYSADMKCSFKTFSACRIRGSFKDLYRKRCATEYTNADPYFLDKIRFEQRTDAFEHLIHGLEERSKEVLRLKHIKGYDCQEIGEILNISLRYARSLVTKAHKALKSKGDVCLDL